jgi:hypothetical protein
MDIFNLEPDWLFNPVSVESAVVARLDRVTSGCEDTPCDAAALKEMVNILQFEAFSLGEEEIYHGNLVWLVPFIAEANLKFGSLPMQNRSKRK